MNLSVIHNFNNKLLLVIVSIKLISVKNISKSGRDPLTQKFMDTRGQHHNWHLLL